MDTIQNQSAPFTNQSLSQPNQAEIDKTSPLRKLFFSKWTVLLGLLLIFIVGITIGAYSYGLQKGIKSLSLVTPTPIIATPSSTITPINQLSKVSFPSPSPYKTPAYTRSDPQYNCKTNDDCMLFDNTRTTYIEMGCGGNQCPNDFDNTIIAVNKEWYIQEHEKAVRLVGGCSQMISVCSSAIQQSWREVSAVCKNNTCQKSQ